MDFFGHQEAARRKTSLLVAYFVLAVVMIIAVVYAAVVLIFVQGQTEGSGQPIEPAALWNPGLFALVSVGVLTVIVAGSLYKLAVLRRGGQAVAEALGASLVNPDTRDVQERRLLNVVQEMAIASGTPVPPVYVLRGEAAINAFAAGYSLNDAVVAVTRGALQTLSRDELQGVIAHEFSHILNGDMRLNIRLMGVLHGILLIGMLGEGVLRSRRYSSYTTGARTGSRRDGAGVVVFALALMVVGYIGVFFGKLIKAAVSRQREFLADAAAVQFTRYPDGIAGALKKIGGLTMGSKLAAPNVELASHLYFANGLSAPFMQLVATHPPLEERIRRIDPHWDGSYPVVRADQPEETAEAAAVSVADARSVTGALLTQPAAAAAESETSFSLTPETSVASAGVPTPAHLTYARVLVSELPAIVQEAAREPYGARALAYALLVSRDEAVQKTQLERLREHADPGVLNEFHKIHSAVARLSRAAYLPLIDLSLPALRGLSANQYRDFRENLEHLIVADRKTSPFEFALLSVFRRHLDQHFFGKKKAVTGYHTLNRLVRECGVLLSALAHVGQEDPESAANAFEAGLSCLDIKAKPSLAPAERSDLPAVGIALDRLERVFPLLKRQLIAACTATIALDSRVTVKEAEILRAVADSLDVPMPPFLAGVSTEVAAKPRGGQV